MKISFYDPPYTGLVSYIEGEKSSGINRDLSRHEPSCNELMASILGVPDKNKILFRHLEVTARLISDEIVAYEPPIYKGTGEEATDTAVWNIARLCDEQLGKLQAEEKVDFYLFRSKQGQLVEESISALMTWEDYYFKTLWRNLDDAAKQVVCSRIQNIMDQYYPLKFIHEYGQSHLFLSSNPYINQLYLKSQTRMSAENILAILAMSGVKVVLPSVYAEQTDVIDEIKEKFSAEREDYIAFLRQYINDCYLGIQSGDYKDVWAYAEYKSNNELLGKLYLFEKAVAGSDKKLIRDSIHSVAGKSVAIAQAIISLNPVKAGWHLLEALIEAIKGGTDRMNVTKELLMVSYLYQIKNR